MNAVPDQATFITPPEARRLLAAHIIDDTAARHLVTRADIRSDVRADIVIKARREAAWQIARDTDFSLPVIGKMLNKDHTSIIHAIRRENEIRSTNVRGLGGISSVQRERNRRAAQRHRNATSEKDQDEAIRLFRLGHDTMAIAALTGWRESRAANALAHYRARGQ